MISIWTINAWRYTFYYWQSILLLGTQWHMHENAESPFMNRIKWHSRDIWTLSLRIANNRMGTTASTTKHIWIQLFDTYRFSPSLFSIIHVQQTIQNYDFSFLRALPFEFDQNLFEFFDDRHSDDESFTSISYFQSMLMPRARGSGIQNVKSSQRGAFVVWQ